MCVCVMAVAVYSATRNLYLIFKTVLIYCNLYKVVKICHKFSMPTVILCNSVLKTHSLQKVTSTYCFLIPYYGHGDDEQTQVGRPCTRTVLLMLCALLSGPPPVMQGCSSLAALQ